MLNFNDDYQIRIEKKTCHPKEIFQKSSRYKSERSEERNYFLNPQNNIIKLPQIKTNNLKYFEKEKEIKTKKGNRSLKNFTLVSPISNKIIQWQGLAKINNFSHGYYNEKKKQIKKYLEDDRFYLLNSIQQELTASSKYIDYTDVLDILKYEDSSIMNF